jgi:putative membrane protein
MVRFLISTGLHLLGNAIGLLVAAWVLDDMSMDGLSLVFAVLIFTVVEVIAQPLIRKIAVKNAEALLGSVALVTTFVGLLITEIFSDGMDIQGAWTWVLATIIVWLVAMLAALVLPAIFLKKKVTEARA